MTHKLLEEAHPSRDPVTSHLSRILPVEAVVPRASPAAVAAAAARVRTPVRKGQNEGRFRDRRS